MKRASGWRTVGVWGAVFVVMASTGQAVVAPLPSGGTPDVIQATARPLGLGIAGPVMQAGSDASSAQFQSSVLPSINKLLSVQLSERAGINDSAHLLDPARLRLKTESDIRVYFVGEGAGYRNTLGYSLSLGGGLLGSRELIFPDASSPVSTYDPAKTPVRTSTMPLLPGDYVDLGSASGGSLLDFFLVSNGANGGSSTFGTVAASNPDRINHVVAFAMPDSPYLILGFEDMLGGGDRDFNDVLIAVDIGARNVAALTGAPEPGLILILGAFVALAFRHRARLATAKDGTAV